MLTPYNIAKLINDGEKDYVFVLAREGTTNQNMFLLPPAGGLAMIFNKLIKEIDFDGIFIQLMVINMNYLLMKLEKLMDRLLLLKSIGMLSRIFSRMVIFLLDTLWVVCMHPYYVSV